MISVIIPACNEEKYIERTLRSIAMQDHEDREVIVVCNGCSDATARIARKYTDRVYELKEANLSKARNFGASKSKGKKLLFMDADTYFLDPKTLRRIDEHENVIGTCKGKADREELRFKMFFLIKNSLLWKGWVNGLTFCDRNIFEHVKGYNYEKQPYENRDFIKRMRKFGKFGIIKDRIVNSMRRYEKWGFRRAIIFWTKNLFKKMNGYETIR